MIVRLCFKTPDVIDYALDQCDFEDEAKRDLLDDNDKDDITESMIEEKADELRSFARENIAKKVKWGENIIVQYDTDTGEWYV